MFYGFHTTKHSEREMLLQEKGSRINIDPSIFHTHQVHKPIIIEEDTNNVCTQTTEEFFDLLKMIDNGRNDLENSKYVQKFSYKIHDVLPRISHLKELYFDIKRNGIKNPVHCEVTGERLDGAFRTKIAMYLGIKSVPAILHRFSWKDIDDDFVERKLKARWLSSGVDYYEFEYGHKGWKNVGKGGDIYRENAERADVILPLIRGKRVIDIGCNEGYIGLRVAMEGKNVTGYDIEWNHIAYLNKLIFEHVQKRDLNIKFIEKDVLDADFKKADTVLMLNVLYHFPKDRQVDFIKKFNGQKIIFQCNLRKERERDVYFTSHPDDLMKLLKKVGRVGKVIEWRDKPIVVC